MSFPDYRVFRLVGGPNNGMCYVLSSDTVEYDFDTRMKGGRRHHHPGSIYRLVPSTEDKGERSMEYVGPCPGHRDYIAELKAEGKW